MTEEEKSVLEQYSEQINKSSLFLSKNIPLAQQLVDQLQVIKNSGKQIPPSLIFGFNKQCQIMRQEVQNLDQTLYNMKQNEQKFAIPQK